MPVECFEVGEIVSKHARDLRGDSFVSFGPMFIADGDGLGGIKVFGVFLKYQAAGICNEVLLFVVCSSNYGGPARCCMLLGRAVHPGGLPRVMGFVRGLCVLAMPSRCRGASVWVALVVARRGVAMVPLGQCML